MTRPCRTPTYNTWSMMKQRCYNPKATDYKWYGAKGIRVCERWRKSFNCFLADMGARPDGMTLDRKDAAGNYTPRNCRWATPIQQTRSRSYSIGEVAAAQIRWLCTDGGYQQKTVAAAFGLSKQTVNKVVRGRSYKEVAAADAG